MPRRTTMQQLCTEIQSGDVRTYLLANDWRVAESHHADAVFFEKDSDDDQAYRVWIWASRDRPKFASRIQNLLFSLSVIEGREPLEIGNAILESAEPAPPAPSTSTLRISVQNVYEHTIECNIGGCDSGSYRLLPSESLELVFTGPNRVPPQLLTGSRGVDVHCDTAESIRVFQGVPQHTHACPVARIVREELQRGGITDAHVARLLSELSAVLTRAEFELNTEDDSGSKSPPAVRRQTAIVATALAKQIPDSESAPRIVWLAATRIAAIANLRLELIPTSIAELFRRALEDDELAPAATSGFLKEISEDFSDIA